MHQLQETGFLRLPQILGNPNAQPPIPAIIPVGKSTWWNGVKSGRYPQPVKLSRRCTAWRVEDIRALIAAVAMSADTLLSRLDKVKRTGQGRYVACCPAHDDKGPSLTIKELDDGRILLHCFAGCDVYSGLSALDLSMADLFPEREQIPHGKPERRPFPAADVLRAVGFEALVMVIAATSLVSGEPFTAIDRERLVLAASRIQAALSAVGVNHA